NRTSTGEALYLRGASSGVASTSMAAPAHSNEPARVSICRVRSSIGCPLSSYNITDDRGIVVASGSVTRMERTTGGDDTAAVAKRCDKRLNRILMRAVRNGWNSALSLVILAITCCNLLSYATLLI